MLEHILPLWPPLTPTRAQVKFHHLHLDIFLIKDESVEVILTNESLECCKNVYQHNFISCPSLFTLLKKLFTLSFLGL